MSNRGNDPVEILCKIERDEAGSPTIAISAGTEEDYTYNGRTRKRLKWFWLNRKHVLDRADHKDGTSTLTIPAWLAEDRGLDADVQ